MFLFTVLGNERLFQELSDLGFQITRKTNTSKMYDHRNDVS